LLLLYCCYFDHIILWFITTCPLNHLCCSTGCLNYRRVNLLLDRYDKSLSCVLLCFPNLFFTCWLVLSGLPSPSPSAKLTKDPSFTPTSKRLTVKTILAWVTCLPICEGKPTSYPSERPTSKWYLFRHSVTVPCVVDGQTQLIVWQHLRCFY